MSLPLSRRQRECLLLTARGLSHREIAAQLGISPHTVRHYLAECRLRLGANTLVEAWRTLGWLEPPED